MEWSLVAGLCKCVTLESWAAKGDWGRGGRGGEGGRRGRVWGRGGERGGLKKRCTFATLFANCLTLRYWRLLLSSRLFKWFRCILQTLTTKIELLFKRNLAIQKAYESLPPYMYASYVATHCNKLQHTAYMTRTCGVEMLIELYHAATHCNKLQHTATNCNTLKYTTTHCIDEMYLRSRHADEGLCCGV